MGCFTRMNCKVSINVTFNNSHVYTIKVWAWLICFIVFRITPLIAQPSLTLPPSVGQGLPKNLVFSYKLSTTTAGSTNTYSSAEDNASANYYLRRVTSEPSGAEINASSSDVISISNLRSPRRLATAEDENGKIVLTAFYTTSSSTSGTIVLRVYNSINSQLSTTGSVTIPAIAGYDQERPLLLLKKPGSRYQYYLLFHETGSGDVYYNVIDLSLTGTGTTDQPGGGYVTQNNLLLDGSDYVYGDGLTAIENIGPQGYTMVYFAGTRVSGSTTTFRVAFARLEGTGFSAVTTHETINSSRGLAAGNGMMKVSTDGSSLLVMHAGTSSSTAHSIRRYGVNADGTLGTGTSFTIVGNTTTSNNSLLDAEYSPSGKYIFYGLRYSSSSTRRFIIFRRNLSTGVEESVYNSESSEVISWGLTITRHEDGRLYIVAGNHERIIVLGSPDATALSTTNNYSYTLTPPGATSTAGIYLTGINSRTYDRHRKPTGHGMHIQLAGKKLYELNDHLGNVSTVVSDKKLTDGTAELMAVNNYYPFGSLEPGRNYSSPSYRYGFNGMEKDDELKGSGNSYDFGARLYDPRVGRWLTRDPLAIKFADQSPYDFTFNNPIYFVDPDGMAPRSTQEGIDAIEKDYTIEKTIATVYFGVLKLPGAIGYVGAAIKNSPTAALRIVAAGEFAFSVLEPAGFYVPTSAMGLGMLMSRPGIASRGRSILRGLSETTTQVAGRILGRRTAVKALEKSQSQAILKYFEGRFQLEAEVKTDILVKLGSSMDDYNFMESGFESVYHKGLLHIKNLNFTRFKDAIADPFRSGLTPRELLRMEANEFINTAKAAFNKVGEMTTRLHIKVTLPRGSSEMRALLEAAESGQTGLRSSNVRINRYEVTLDLFFNLEDKH